MLRIRLTRTGAKKNPHYRVVVIERERARDGRFLEILGHYDPRAKAGRLQVNRERVDYWISKGARPTDTMGRLLGAPAVPPAAPSSG